MNTERVVRIFAGAVVLISILLVIYHSQWWLLLTAFVGANLLQSGFTQFCPLDKMLRAMGLPSCGEQNTHRA
jgi:disulfide bond formation protein DsbB